MSKSIGLSLPTTNHPTDASCLKCEWRLDRDEKYLFCRNRECEAMGIMTVAYCFDAKEVEPEIL
jgi:hypothetical protein